MNQLAARITRRGAEGDASVLALSLDREAGFVPLQGAAAHAVSAAPSERVILGVRAEDCRIAAQEQGDGLRATVYAVEPLGDRYIYDLQLGGYVIKVKSPPSQVFDVGRPVWVTFDAAHLHLFDAAGEQRLPAPDAASAPPAPVAAPDGAQEPRSAAHG
jgi:multiple sugar transport system ATP-binding protein